MLRGRPLGIEDADLIDLSSGQRPARDALTRASGKPACLILRGYRTGRRSAAFCMSIFPAASEVPMTHSEERIYSILSLAAIGLGLVLALALAS